MKKYTRPTVIKVELNHEQAVLGTCSANYTDAVADSATNYCRDGACKQGDNHPTGDSAGSS